MTVRSFHASGIPGNCDPGKAERGRQARNGLNMRRCRVGTTYANHSRRHPPKHGPTYGCLITDYTSPAPPGRHDALWCSGSCFKTEKPEPLGRAKLLKPWGFRGLGLRAYDFEYDDDFHYTDCDMSNNLHHTPPPPPVKMPWAGDLSNDLSLVQGALGAGKLHKVRTLSL